MLNKPVVFISSTSDLRSARDLVGKVLHSMGYEPVWQDIEATDGGELLDVLRKRIEPCSLLIQLVGDRYGAEPPSPSPEFGRVSYTQFESLYAEKLGRKVVYYFMDPSFPTDLAELESDERRELQAAYRQQITADNKLRQSNIASTQDLELSIRRITDELAAARKQSDRRFKRLFVVSAVSLLSILLIIGLVIVSISGQKEVTVKFNEMTSRLDESEKLIKQFLTERPLDANGKPIISQLTGELRQRAEELIAKGNKRQRLIAAVAMNDFTTADRLLVELRAMNQSERDTEDFELFTLEGDRWYRANEPDKAIEPIERAIALRATHIGARNNAAIAHTSARLGNIADHKKRAIEIAKGTLTLVTHGSIDWADAQQILGIAWAEMPTGDRNENLGQAIKSCEAALTVFTKESHPAEWATTQGILGNVWSAATIGDRAENCRRAIEFYEAALTVFTKESHLVGWAGTQLNLGATWAELPAGNRAENLRRAMEAFASALTVFTKESHPVEWATTQRVLGIAWIRTPTGNQGENLRLAIDACEAALMVFTKESHPVEWARTQNSLASALGELPTGNRGENLRRAIEAFEASLTVRTKESHPFEWARTQFNLGNAWRKMPPGNGAENLRRAIEAYEAALTVFTQSAHPVEWAGAQNNLGFALHSMPTGDRGKNLRRAIEAYEAALAIYTVDKYPEVSKSIQLNLSWSQILAKDFKGALATIGAVSNLYTPHLPLEANHAHALLFLDQTESAKAIYLKHVGEEIGGKLWQTVILEDFDAIEIEGFTHPQFQTLRELLKARK
ncbi:MAG: DUF4062 domain-containing protein [Phycisphaeraceae bacterium]